MKLLYYYIVLTCFSLLSGSIRAQQLALPGDVKKTFYYSFENVASDEQIERLKRNVSTLKGVSEVKSEYKPEKATGQIMVVVIERKRTLEGDTEFDIRSLKNAIIQNQLQPLELTQEETVIEN
jgi:nitrate reductase NapAB chaperone NapD